MPITERDRNRLAAIIAIIRPAHSLEARLKKLSSAHREIYDEWKASWDQWFAQCKADDSIDDDSYARPYYHSLQGRGPRLPVHVAKALHGPETLIPLTATEEEAGTIYYRYMEAGR